MTRTMMTRRVFVSALCGLGATAAMSACTGQSARNEATKPRLIGYLSANATATSEPHFRQALRDLAYVEGRDLTYEVRNADNKNDRLPALCTELIGLQAVVLVTQGSPATLAAKQATSTIPIVFIRVNTPVAQGIVADEARPGGNVTGVVGPRGFFADLKQIELLQEAVPGLTRIAMLANANNPSAVTQVRNFADEARARALDLRAFSLRSTVELDDALDQIATSRAEALLVGLGFTLARDLKQIPDFAAKYRLPAIYSTDPDFVRSGGLMAFGSNTAAQSTRAAQLVDRILKGAHPAELPVEHTTELDLVVNLSAAQRIGLTLPQSFLRNATEILR